MSIKTFFNKHVYIQRLKIDLAYKKSLATTATADASIQPDLSFARGQTPGVQSARWLGFFDFETDIKEEDVILDTVDSKEYKIIEIRIIDFGLNQHKEAVLEEFNA